MVCYCRGNSCRNQCSAVGIVAMLRVGWFGFRNPVWQGIVCGHAVALLVEALRYKLESRSNFHWLNSFGRTTGLGSAQPLREMGTRETSCGVEEEGAYIWHIHVSTVWKSGSLKLSESSGPLQACMGIVLPVRVAEAGVEVAAVMWELYSSWGRYKGSSGGEIICRISTAVDYLASSAKFFPINDSTCSESAIGFNISSLKFGSKDN